MTSARDIVLTVAAGAIGGLLTNIPALSEPALWGAFGPASWIKFVVGPIALGATAAGIGVFVLTSTDTTQKPRMFFFALICGLAFPTIISNAKDSVSTLHREVDTQLSQEATATLRRLVEDSAKPDQVAKAASEALFRASRTQDQRSKEDAADAVNSSIEQLSADGGADSALQLATIGATAAQTLSLDVTTTVLKELNQYSDLATHAEKAQIAHAQKAVIDRLPADFRLEAKASAKDIEASNSSETATSAPR